MDDAAGRTGLIGGVEKRAIKIVAYESRWRETFQTHANIIASALGHAAPRIEHIGSTSVHGLAAKPIVDMLLVVEDSGNEAAYLSKMEAVGYEAARSGT